MTFTEKRPTKTLPNAKSRDAKICLCNVQSGFPRAEARPITVSMTTYYEAYVLDMDQ